MTNTNATIKLTAAEFETFTAARAVAFRYSALRLVHVDADARAVFGWRGYFESIAEALPALRAAIDAAIGTR